MFLHSYFPCCPSPGTHLSLSKQHTVSLLHVPSTHLLSELPILLDMNTLIIKLSFQRQAVTCKNTLGISSCLSMKFIINAYIQLFSYFKGLNNY